MRVAPGRRRAMPMWGVPAFLGACAVITQSTFAQTTTHRVELRSSTFVPANLTIRLGDTVHWVWVTGFHNVESGVVDAGLIAHPDGRFRSGDPTPTPGATFDVTFDAAFLADHPAPGRSYPYYCIAHADAGMVGTIGVVDCLTGSDCPDANPCTDDLCQSGVCSHVFNTSPCDDGNPCTSGDICNNGVCGGSPVAGCCRAHADCNDGNVCTNDACEGSVCRSTPGPNVPCDDGNSCTGPDACAQGICIGTPLTTCCRSDRDCDDALACTDDRCIGGSCVNPANDAACDDDDLCTADDTCVEGVCLGERIEDCCRTNADCPSLPCTTARCVRNQCVVTPLPDCEPCTEAADCDDDDVCTADRCTAGVCQSSSNAADCDDADPCTENDRCTAGACVGNPIENCCVVSDPCDDHDECTEDFCASKECRHTPIPDCGQPNPGDQDDPPDDETDALPVDDEPPAPRPTPRPAVCGALGLIPLALFAVMVVVGRKLICPRRVRVR